jgi:hypothetical protein
VDYIDELLHHLERAETCKQGGNNAAASGAVGRLHQRAASLGNFTVTAKHERAMKVIFDDRRNVLLTGGAGTGKTVFTRDILIPELDWKGKAWAVTAMTGIAGSHLDGKTLHAWAGIGHGVDWSSARMAPQDMPDDMLESAYERAFEEWNEGRTVRPFVRDGVRRRLQGADVLIVDEISMCHGDGLLGYLDYKLRRLRDPNLPFGGLQMIFVGDFAQIPPVETENKGTRPDWAFLSRCWQEAKVEVVNFDAVFRQGDEEFIRFLNAIRMNQPYDRNYTRQFMRQLSREELESHTFLVPTNKQAKRINDDALLRYPEPTITIDAAYCIEESLLANWERPHEVKQALQKSLRLVDPTLFLRKGCPVMITRNAPDGAFVNGTRGFLRDYIPDKHDGKHDQLVIGVPTRGGKEEPVFLGRWTFSRDRKQDPAAMVTLEDPETGKKKSTHRWPVILQFPVIPASAITVHKSQGLSMDKAVLSLIGSFAPGQVYVGLSRLRSPEGLVLLDDRFVVQTDPHVVRFYQSLK